MGANPSDKDTLKTGSRKILGWACFKQHGMPCMLVYDIIDNATTAFIN